MTQRYFNFPFKSSILHDAAERGDTHLLHQLLGISSTEHTDAEEVRFIHPSTVEVQVVETRMHRNLIQKYAHDGRCGVLPSISPPASKITHYLMMSTPDKPLLMIETSRHPRELL